MDRLYIYGGLDIKEGARDSMYYIELEGEPQVWVRMQLKGSVPGTG